MTAAIFEEVCGLGPDDVGLVHRILVSSLPPNICPSQAHLSRWFEKYPRFARVWLFNGQPAGVVLFDSVEPGRACLRWFGVLPGLRSQGIARRGLQVLLRGLDSIGVDRVEVYVPQGADAATRLLARLQFNGSGLVPRPGFTRMVYDVPFRSVGGGRCQLVAVSDS